MAIDISSIANGNPIDGRVTQFDVVRNMASGFGNDLQAAYYREIDHLILLEILQRHGADKPSNPPDILFDIGEPLAVAVRRHPPSRS
jgi:hypothetical protein